MLLRVFYFNKKYSLLKKYDRNSFFVEVLNLRILMKIIMCCSIYRSVNTEESTLFYKADDGILEGLAKLPLYWPNFARTSIESATRLSFDAFDSQGSIDSASETFRHLETSRKTRRNERERGKCRREKRGEMVVPVRYDAFFRSLLSPIPVDRAERSGAERSGRLGPGPATSSAGIKSRAVIMNDSWGERGYNCD